jgi:hypothetical protein
MTKDYIDRVRADLARAIAAHGYKAILLALAYDAAERAVRMRKAGDPMSADRLDDKASQLARFHSRFMATRR